uniref:Uncharacterized protein n=1 Tax=Oryza nivara TaxID=4536 RepID=A0A0E0HZA8_ORYNI
MERWPVCGEAWRSRRCKRRSAAVATATAACSRSSPESGGARARAGSTGEVTRSSGRGGKRKRRARGLGEEKSWPDVADLKRQRPATWATPWAKWGSIWRQKLGKSGGFGGGGGGVT